MERKTEGAIFENLVFSEIYNLMEDVEEKRQATF